MCETDSILGFCGLVRLQVIYGQLAPSLHVSLSIFTERNLFLGPSFLLCLGLQLSQQELRLRGRRDYGNRAIGLVTWILHRNKEGRVKSEE